MLLAPSSLISIKAMQICQCLEMVVVQLTVHPRGLHPLEAAKAVIERKQENPIAQNQWQPFTTMGKMGDGGRAVALLATCFVLGIWIDIIDSLGV